MPGITRRRRLEVGSRALAAVFGGYVATAMVTALLARMLPLSRPEATHAATLFSFVIYVGLVLAVFQVATATRGWLIIAATAAGPGLLWLITGPAT